ncbi:MAG: aromatic amino acid ammonia-lyase [Conexivisphaerales archaeon]
MRDGCEPLIKGLIPCRETELHLDGKSLNLENISLYLLSDEEVLLSSDSLERVRSFRKRLEERLSRGEQVYGSTTGFGVLSRKKIEDLEMVELQKNLVRSHAVGAGIPMPDDVVRVAMLVKLNSLLRGNSCVRPEVVEIMAQMMNKHIIPVIPSYGSLGASGDLAPSAYLAMAMIGEGEAKYGGRILPSGRALEEAGLKPLVLQPKEGLSLLNGTCFTTAFAVIASIELKHILSWANCCTALASEVMHACKQSFDARLMDMRGLAGQKEVAASLMKLLEGTKRLRDDPIPQDPYSIRCVPQVHGAVVESLRFAAGIVESELNSVTDNPVMSEDGAILHGGNFHAQPVAMVLDVLSISSTYISQLSLARIHKLMEKSIAEKRDFLAKRPGLESGLMLTEYLAVALNNANSVLLHPASSYPADVSAGVEDHASHGVNAGLKALEILSNVSRVLAVELISLSNFLDGDEEGLADNSKLVLRFVRNLSPPLKGDRSLGSEIEGLALAIRKKMPPARGIF